MDRILELVVLRFSNILTIEFGTLFARPEPQAASMMNSLKGHLLVAKPTLLAPFFTRAVILMLEHNEEGALGVVLNRTTDATVADIADQILPEPLDWGQPISLGGPVPGPLMVIHTVEGLGDQEVIPGVYSTAEADSVRELLLQRVEPCLVVANYAGWGPGQLEGEIGEDSWFCLPATARHVFWDDAADLWESVVDEGQSIDLVRILGVRRVPPKPDLN
jgi:putative transcriptional regulator